MSMAIYLKQFTSELTSDAASQLKKMVALQMKSDTARLQGLVASSAPGLSILRTVTDLCVQTCLNEVCEAKFKAQLIQTINKQLLVFQKFSVFNPEPFSQCL